MRARTAGLGGGDPGRSAVEAARRARGQIRRYCAANALTRFGTLTYAGDGLFDQPVLREHLAEFFRGVRSALGGRPLPYVWVPEWHKNHGLHAHFAFGRYVPRHVLVKAWGRGLVHIKLIGDLPVGSGALAEARIAARYLSKYAGKAFDDDRHLSGLHRYEVAQGFQPDKVTVRAVRLEDAIGEASAIMGSAPSYRWDSTEADDIAGPPMVWCSWG